MAQSLAELEIKGKEYENYPMGAHLAQITDINFQPADRYPDPQLRWKLDLPDVETQSGDPATVYYYTPTDATIKNKLGRMLLALGKQVPRPGEALKVAPFVGLWCQVVITHKMSTDGTGSVVMKLTEILPITPKQRATLVAQKVLSADEPAPAAPAQQTMVLPPSAPATAAEASAKPADVQAAVTAEEDAKKAAVGELRPLLVVLLDTLKEKGEKLTAGNTGPGLKALGKSAKAQECPIPEISFDLVSMANIALAKSETMTLLGMNGEAADDDDDVFAEE